MYFHVIVGLIHVAATRRTGSKHTPIEAQADWNDPFPTLISNLDIYLDRKITINARNE